VIVVLALLLVACSTDEGGDGAGSGGGNAKPSTTVDLSVLGTPKPASGKPVVIGFGAGLGDESQAAGAKALLDGAKVGVAYQNEYRGGLGGRPIELFTCDLKALPETAVDCANQYVEKGVAAVLIPVASNSGSVVPIVTGAGIPYVSFAATSLDELASKGAFSIAGGGAGGLGSVALDAQQRKYKTLSHVLLDVPQLTLVAKVVGDPLFKAAGIKQEVILAPVGVADLTAQLSTATGDAILISADGATCAAALRAYQTLGLDTPLYLQTPCITDDIKKSLPGIFKGVSVATSLSDSESGDALFAAMVQRFDPDNQVARRPVEAGQYAVGLSTVLSFAGALEGIAEPTKAAISAGLEASGVRPLALGDPVTFDCGKPILALASSLCSVQGHIVRLDAEGRVTETKFFDPTALFETALAN
jgi:branched-chain amino acid transport system substrate-binding protein